MGLVWSGQVADKVRGSVQWNLALTCHLSRVAANTCALYAAGIFLGLRGSLHISD